MSAVLDRIGHVDRDYEHIPKLVRPRPSLALDDAMLKWYDVAPAASLVPLPPSLDSLPFPGEALGCAMNVFRRADIRAGQNVAVVGVGFLGALLVQMAARAGARVAAVSRRPVALEMARAFGAEDTLPLEPGVGTRLRERTGGRGYERVIEAVGHQTALDLASELAAERGRLVIAGYLAGTDGQEPLPLT